ncbi:putative baseplate assembly protein V (gpv) [Novosphingobium pentaromativorans US6-1]|uniref:Putative baseplate assembly protein V (Gpv) n=2 Tax=Novosphingobium pentaromativorans TaxID=205844 RepID=G6EFH9_9SPHN|nr:putative baseplate assembly protein V (gpv) [Novosphingobium pentaromativorans US6-1]
MAAWRGIGIFAVMRTPQDTPTDPDALLRYVTIASVDLAAARCSVTIDASEEDGAVESPPLPWLAPRMGDTKAWLPPSVGEQALLLCPGGEIGAGVVVGGLTCHANPAPIDEPVALLRFKDGASLTYDPDAHELLLQLPAGATTVLASDGGIDLIGNVNLTGTLTASEDVTASGVSLKGHKHGGVQGGGSQTGGPV